MNNLLTPAQLAEKTGIALQTIYNRRNLGASLPRLIRIGRLIRFDPSDVEAWLEGLRQEQPLPLNPEPRKVGRPTKAEEIAKRSKLPPRTTH